MLTCSSLDNVEAGNCCHCKLNVPEIVSENNCSTNANCICASEYILY